MIYHLDKINLTVEARDCFLHGRESMDSVDGVDGSRTRMITFSFWVYELPVLGNNYALLIIQSQHKCGSMNKSMEARTNCGELCEA